MARGRRIQDSVLTETSGAARLFVPLAGDPYAWFASGAKRWEVRRARAAFAPECLTIGRRVELRRGYNTPDSIWGTIAEVVCVESPEELFDVIPHGEVIPVASDDVDAAEMVRAILRIDTPRERLVAFRVAVAS